jgi:S-methylmethionine-dependent homocysteine/selenocysteine methylase
LSVLFNCSEPESISSALRIINNNPIVSKCLRDHNIVLGAYANRLTAIVDDWTLASSDGPQASRLDLDPTHYCEDFAKSWVHDYNVKVIGGCCGITPAHIAVLKRDLV